MLEVDLLTLRKDLTRLIQAAQDGETVHIKRYGQTVAKLVGPDAVSKPPEADARIEQTIRPTLGPKSWKDRNPRQAQIDSMLGRIHGKKK